MEKVINDIKSNYNNCEAEYILIDIYTDRSGIICSLKVNVKFYKNNSIELNFTYDVFTSIDIMDCKNNISTVKDILVSNLKNISLDFI